MTRLKRIEQNQIQLELLPHNYEVKIRDWNGERTILCDTVKQAWDALGKRTFGGAYTVSSPTDKCTREFIPY